MVADLFYFRTDIEQPFLFCSWQTERNWTPVLAEQIRLLCLFTQYFVREIQENKNWN
jgi:hypothetical protein